MRAVKFGLTSILASSLLVGTAIGVTAQDEAEAAAPVEFTGKLGMGACERGSTSERLAGKVELRGEYYCRPGAFETFSDPRLQGDYYVWPWRDSHDRGPTIWAVGFSIVNEEGAWRGIPAIFLDEVASGDHILVGEGAYEGLTAIAAVEFDGTVWSWHGWIIEGDVPPLPSEPEAIP